MSDKKEFGHTFAAWLGDQQIEGVRDVLTNALDSIYAAGPDPARLSIAQDGLRKVISEARSMSLFYGVMKYSPVGSIFISVDKEGVVALNIGVSETDFVSALERRCKRAVIRSPEKVAGVIEQLQEYFEGKRSSFELDLNLQYLTQFQRRVLLAALEVPHGQITTYGEIARRLGKVRLARAVGQALARNPLPILIPCHRVLGADGSLHGYSGGKGLETKGQLLRLEGALRG